MVSGKNVLLRVMEGARQSDDLSSADQVMPWWLVKGYIPGKLKLQLS